MRYEGIVSLDLYDGSLPSWLWYPRIVGSVPFGDTEIDGWPSILVESPTQGDMKKIRRKSRDTGFFYTFV